jgi:hypothetical protein
MTLNPSLSVQDSAQKDLHIRTLNELAASGLSQMFDPARGLFCFRMKRTEKGLVREGVSHRYTIMTLLGLGEFERSGRPSPIPFSKCMETLLSERNWVNNVGDLGLLLWLCAVEAPGRLEEIRQTYSVDTALTRYRDAQEHRTMELAWFLTGVSQAAISGSGQSRGWKDLAEQTCKIVQANQGPHGFFGHLARSRSLAGVIRGWVGSFADQVYPILALTKFAQALQAKEALDAAKKCAVAICKAQGELGQWWWHYDSMTGHVLQHYPVYSVHQHGMAPMALLAIGGTTGRDFSEAIYKGLRWVLNANELNTNMCDASVPAIWRCIQPVRKLDMYANEILGFLKLSRERARRNNLRILFECRPYELGWLLYAFAGYVDR